MFALYSPILCPVFHAPTSGVYPFAIVCKGCHQNIPAPVETMPGSWIIAECPLCGQRRRYLPTDIFQGRLSQLVTKLCRTGGKKWGEMRRAIAREEQERRNQDRFASTVVIAAAIIAAVRLARDYISSPSRRVRATMADSVSLARIILKRVVGA